MANSDLQSPLVPGMLSKQNRISKGFQDDLPLAKTESLETEKSPPTEFDNLNPLLTQRFIISGHGGMFGGGGSRDLDNIFVSPEGKLIATKSGLIEIMQMQMRNRRRVNLSTEKITSIVFINSDDAFITDNSGFIYKLLFSNFEITNQKQLSNKPVTSLRYSKAESCLYAGGDSLYKIDPETLNFEVTFNKSVNSLYVYKETIAVCSDGIQLIKGSHQENISDGSFLAIALYEQLIAAVNTQDIVIWKEKTIWKRFPCSGKILDIDFAQSGLEVVVKIKDEGLKFWHLTEPYKPKTVGKGLIDVIGIEDYTQAILVSDLTIQKYRVQPWTKDRYISNEDEIIQGVVSGDKYYISHLKDKLCLRFFEDDKTAEINNCGTIKKILLSKDESTVFLLCDNKSIKSFKVCDLEIQEIYLAKDFEVTDFYISDDKSSIFLTENDNLHEVTIDTSAIQRSLDLKRKRKQENASVGILRCRQLINGVLYLTTNFELIMVNPVDFVMIIRFPIRPTEKMVISPDEEIMLKTKRIQQNKTNISSNFMICHAKTGKLIKKQKLHKGLISDFVFTKDNKYFFVACEDSSVSLWSRETLDVITCIKYSKPVIGFSLGMQENKMIINEGGRLYLSASPLTNTELQVYGPSDDQFSAYCLYICQISKLLGKQHHKMVIPYKPELDDYIITPGLYNTLHFYAWYAHFDSYNKSLKTSSFHNSITGKSPLSILVTRDEAEQALETLKFKSKEIQLNAYALGFINNATLIQLNNRGYTGLQEFYSNAIVDSKDPTLPKYCLESVNLPQVVYKSEPEPISNSFMPQESYKDGIPILFHVSLIPVNMIQGSQESLDLIKSIIECSNLEIYNTDFLKLLLRDKWKAVKIYMVIMALLYMAYLIMLSIFIINLADTIQNPNESAETKLFVGEISLYIGFIVNLVMIFYEFVQMRVNGLDYWRDIWNIIDITRFLLYSLVTIVVMFSDHNQNTSWGFTLIEIILVLISWIRGLTYFRIFDTTRYLTALVFEVLGGISSFMFLTVYSVIGLSLMLFCSLESKYKDDFYFSFLGFTYMTTLGEYSSFDQDISNFQFTGIIIFTIASVINTIVMMNLLISIIGDTFDRVQQGIAVADLRQLGAMVYEIESLMSWNKDLKERKFMQRVTTRFGGIDNHDLWTGKIREIKTAVYEGYKKIEKKMDEEFHKGKKLEKKMEERFDKLGNEIAEIKASLKILLENR